MLEAAEWAGAERVVVKISRGTYLAEELTGGEGRRLRRAGGAGGGSGGSRQAVRRASWACWRGTRANHRHGLAYPSRLVTHTWGHGPGPSPIPELDL